MTEARQPESAQELARRGRYVGLLAQVAVLGIPVSLAAFGFLALLHWMTELVWEVLPERLGLDPTTWWWPFPWLALAGVLVGCAIRYLPGHGGHPPVEGLGIGSQPPSQLPGVAFAALAGLPLGAVLGPEGPLLAMGSGVALLLARPWGVRPDSQTGSLVSTAGATAAVAVIFGSPLIAAVFILEAVGLAGPKLARVILPCLLSAGVGAVVFTGLGDWTGLSIPSLQLPELDAPARPDLGDLLWTVPVAVAIAFLVRQVHRGGIWVSSLAKGRPFTVAVAAALLVALSAGAYALLTGRSPAEVALSGQTSLVTLAADPHSWPIGALIAVLVFKSLAYGASSGALRGGLIFPAVFLGAAAGVLVAGLPGYGAVPAMAAGMAAATVSILPLPVSSVVLITLLLGSDAIALTPVVLIAVVVAFVSEQLFGGPSAQEPGHQPSLLPPFAPGPQDSAED